MTIDPMTDRAPRPEGMTDARLAEIVAELSFISGADAVVNAGWTFDAITDLANEVARLRADEATLLHRAEQAETTAGDAKREIDRLVVRCGEFSEAHAASFKALQTLSAALLDGEVDDYAALAEKIIGRVRQLEADGATLRERVRKLSLPWLTSANCGPSGIESYNGVCLWCHVKVERVASPPEHPDNGCLWSDVHKPASAPKEPTL